QMCGDRVIAKDIYLAVWIMLFLLLSCQLGTTCHAFVGETVVLPCTTTPPGEPTLSKSMLYWQIGTNLVHFFKNGQDSLDGQDEKFHGRTSLFLDQMKHGNLSLKISNVQLQDDAEYSCIYRQTDTSQGQNFLLISHVQPLRGITSIFKTIFHSVSFCSLLLLEVYVRKKSPLLSFSTSGLLKARHLPLHPPFEETLRNNVPRF
uniref:Ig-like domain-containing protein n=1 Tax=Cyanistes caeruleus TaxID=156563 RepID=A0A8C0V5C3_CYACU